MLCLHALVVCTMTLAAWKVSLVGRGDEEKKDPGRTMWRSWEDLGSPWAFPWTTLKGIPQGRFGAHWVPRRRPGARRAHPGAHGAQGAISSFRGGVSACKPSIFTEDLRFGNLHTLHMLHALHCEVITGVLL